MVDNNFKNIIKSFNEQAGLYLPSHYKDSEKRLVLKAIEYYSTKAASFISDKKNIDTQSKYYFVQIVGEWTFHKTVDFINSKLPIKYFKKLLQANYEGITSLAYEKFEEKLPLEKILETVEFKVKDVWTAEILQLKKSGSISNERSLIALTRDNFIDLYQEKSKGNSSKNSKKKEKDTPQNNTDKQTQEASVKQKKKTFINIIFSFLAVLSLIFLVLLILNFPSLIKKAYLFSQNYEHFAYYLITFLSSLLLLSRLNIKNKVKKQFLLLEETKKSLSDITNPNFLYSKIHNNHISIGLSEAFGTIENENSDLDKMGLLPRIPALRKILAEQYGYIFPLCKVFENNKLKGYEFEIYVSQNLVLKKEIQSSNISDSYHDIIISELKCVLFQYVDCILTREYVDVLLQNCNYKNLGGLSYDFVFEIITNLLREKVSIKNAIMILEKIFTYYSFYRTPDEISERIREDLAIKISNQYSAQDNSISAVVFDENYENFLRQNIRKIENSIKLVLNNVDGEKLVSKISTFINNNSNKNLVFICDSDVRLPLYRLLSEIFPDIVILSNKEITSDKNLIVLDTIMGEF